MSSRLALESWQLLLPAFGIAIFAAIFLGVVIRVWCMKRPWVDHLGNLPLEVESPKVDAGPRTASLDSRDLNPRPDAQRPSHCQPMDDNHSGSPL